MNTADDGDGDGDMDDDAWWWWWWLVVVVDDDGSGGSDDMDDDGAAPWPLTWLAICIKFNSIMSRLDDMVRYVWWVPLRNSMEK